MPRLLRVLQPVQLVSMLEITGEREKVALDGFAVTVTTPHPASARNTGTASNAPSNERGIRRFHAALRGVAGGQIEMFPGLRTVGDDANRSISTDLVSTVVYLRPFQTA